MKVLFFILALLVVPLSAMEADSVFVASDSGDEPAILEIVRADREVLIKRANFNEVAMITRKSLTPDDSAQDNTLTFNVLKNKDTVLGFTAYHATEPHKVQLALLAVEQKYRGKGNAVKLLASTVTQIRNTPVPVTIWAYVAKNNGAALRVWQKVAGKIPDATLHWEEGTGKASDAFIVQLK